MGESPLLRAKGYGQDSVFKPENLLREGRRQRDRAELDVPPVCMLDPDGDVVRHLVAGGLATEHEGWSCYHTTLWVFDLEGTRVGVVGCAVGAPFAVLVAEQLFASGCELLVSVTSSGSITARADPPYFVLIERALRDEGTSLHYLPPSDWCEAPPSLLEVLRPALEHCRCAVFPGSTWTTDAPFRETPEAIERAERLGVTAVEMEASALYAFAEVRGRDVVCLAHVTNTMATEGDDFEKGEADGAHDALEVVGAVLDAIRARGMLS